MFEDELIYNYIDLVDEEELEQPQKYPLPLIIKEANGCYLIDQNNNRFLDFTSCMEDHPLGYSGGNIGQLSSFFDSELFVSAKAQALEKQFQNFTGLQKTYFTSSCLENYKIAKSLIKKYIEDNQKSKILISSTSSNQDNYVISDIGVNFIPVNFDTVARSVFTKEVGAVVVELVQISSDITIASNEYLKYLRDLCDQNNALLVLDVSSISPLRLGNYFLNYDISIKPDILFVSKGLSRGIPFGAVITSEKLNDYTHNYPKTGSSTLAYEQALKLIDDYNKHDLENIVKSSAKYIEKRLNELAQTHISVVDIHPYGMIFTIILDVSAYELAKQCFEKGIIVEAINPKTIKISPPYIVGKEEIDKLVNILDSLLDKLAKYDRMC
ncbi:MAG: acetylornithine aminotransferase [uncultured bacterium]|nr:MAG: acetylornithine aminotransferase [uncultured bacterium]HBH17416.1 hypothetical protein [Cyanobacteria bacterium UBA9579]